jgi:uncharacterized protein YkwD
MMRSTRRSRRLALPALGLALALSAASPGLAQPPLGGVHAAGGTATQLAALERMNAYRRLAGVAPLRLDDALDQAAVNHATY